MIDETQSVYYLSYGLICAALVVAYIRVTSTEGITITTKEFKQFQSRFLTGYSVMMLCELIALGSFYQIFVDMKLSLEQITKLYIVTIISTTVCGMLTEIFDVGSRKDKCILSAILYSASMFTIFFGTSAHFEMFLIGRVVYGAASALHHSSFESYVIHEHTNLGFPDDWLNQTFSLLTHCLALVAASSGTIGQIVSSSGSLGCVGICTLLFACTAVYIALTHSKDMNGPKFGLSGFMFTMNQTVQAASASRPMLNLLALASLTETTVIIFTFYWAPWMTSLVIEEDKQIPYMIVFSSYVAASMLGNYLHQLFSSGIGADNTFQAVLIGSAAAFTLGSLFQNPSMAFTISLVIQLCVGAYWSCIGQLRGRFILPELRAASLTVIRLVSTLLAVVMLSTIHHSPFLMLTSCAVLNGVAAYLQICMSQMGSAGALSDKSAEDQYDDDEDDDEEKERDKDKSKK